MKILLINTPSRKGENGVMLPLGLLYVGSIIEKCASEAKIFDPYLDDIELDNFDNFKRIDSLIEGYKPSMVGFGGIATSYARAKKLSLHIKDKYPQIMQVAGGPLSSVYDLLLTNTKIEAVFHGETEISLPLFIAAWEQKKEFCDVPGVSYVSNGKVMTNPPAQQIADIDTIPLPAYHLVNMDQYLLGVSKWFSNNNISYRDKVGYENILRKIGNAKIYLPLISSRGCTNKCSFCYRHVTGHRQHSVRYVIDHIKYLRKKYGIGGVQFCDELFNANIKWVNDFCDVLKKEDLGIFYIITGARAGNIDRDVLRRLSKTGCIEINYGQESGSDSILREYRKGITRQQNMDTILMTKQAGLHSVVQLVIGSPGETSGTISETIDFLKKVDAQEYTINYLIPLPGAPIWEYVCQHGLVKDLEAYLDTIAQHGGEPILNLTKANDAAWKGWRLLIRKEMKLHYYRNKNFFEYIIFKYLFPLIYKVASILPRRVIRMIPEKVRQSL